LDEHRITVLPQHHTIKIGICLHMLDQHQKPGRYFLFAARIRFFCQLRRVYDPTGYETSWEEDRAGERGCMQNKKELTEVLNAALEPIRTRRAELLADPAELDRILANGAERARATAAETLRLVNDAMGLR
jgi:hypothetical protein